MINLEKMESYVNSNQVVNSSQVVVGSNKFWDSLKPEQEQSTVKKSIELIYAQKKNAEGRFAAKEEGENRVLYEWSGVCWDRKTDSCGEKDAWEWLKRHAPAMALPAKAGSLFQSALLDLKTLPENPEQNIVPLANLWLEITEDNRLRIRKPDQKLGISYHIKAELNPEEGAEFYEPKDIPEASLFYQFLAMSLPDINVRNLIQEYCGYTLLNDVRFQTAQVWVGDGSNGKSVLLKLISAIHAKVGSIALDDLKGFNLAPVVDSSLLVSSETPKRGINEQEFKKIVTGDPLTVAYKFKDIFTHSPTAKLLIACNRFPHINDESDGVWRRLQIIRWGVNLSREQQIPNLDKSIIKNELHLVVEWCLQGLLRLLDRGDFNEPECVVVHKSEEKRNSNSVLAFKDDNGLKVSNGFTIKKSKLYEQYEQFCESNCLTCFGAPEFWKKLKQVFPNIQEQKKGQNGSRYRVVNLGFGDLSDEDCGTPFDGKKGGV